MKQTRDWKQGEHSQIIVVKAGFLYKWLYNKGFVPEGRDLLITAVTVSRIVSRYSNRREVGIGSIDTIKHPLLAACGHYTTLPVTSKLTAPAEYLAIYPAYV